MNRRDFIDKENYDDSGGSVPKRTIIIKLVKCLFAHHFSTNQIAERNESIKLVAKQKEFSEERAGEECCGSRCSLREFFCDPLGSLPASQKRVHTSHCGTLSLKTREERKDAREWVSVSLTHSNTYFVCTQQSHTPYTEFGRGLSI